MKTRLFLSAIFYLLSSILMSSASAAEDLTSLQAAFLAGRYEQVLSETEMRLKRSGESRDLLLYLRGVAALKMQDVETATLHLHELLTHHPKSQWLAYAWLALGDAFQTAGQPERALEVYNNFLKSGRADPLKLQLSYRMAQLQRELGQWDQARDSLQSLVAESPRSAEGQEARQMLEGGDFYFSIQVGAFVSRANALKLQSELNRRGYPAEVSETLAQGRTFYRVRVGRFSTRDQAGVQAHALKEEGFPARIVP